MKKQFLILTAIALLAAPEFLNAAGVALFAHMGRFKEEMTVGDEQKVNAVTMRITDGHDVVMISETESGKWVVTAIAAGTATVCLEKSKPGHKSKRHKCCHTIVVKDKKGFVAKAKKAIKRVANDVEELAEEIENDVDAGMTRYRDNKAKKQAAKQAKKAQ